MKQSNVQTATGSATPRYIFRNRAGHLRAGWRIAIYAVLSAAGLFGAEAVKSLILPNGGGRLGTTAFNVENTLLCLAFVLPALITLKYVDRRKCGMLGLGFARGWLKELGLGLALGFLVITGVFLVLRVLGFVETTLHGFDLLVGKGVALYLLSFFIAGALEEIVSRGYLLQALIEGTRPLLAIVALSLLFSLMHIRSSTFSWTGGLNLFLLGLILSLVYLKTRSLWMPIGLHVAWNWTMAALWGAKVSGITVENSVFNTSPNGPEMLSGGDFGIEGSLFTTVFALLLVWLIWKAKWIAPSTHNRELWSKYET